jgi:hypothetical protein
VLLLLGASRTYFSQHPQNPPPNDTHTYVHTGLMQGAVAGDSPRFGPGHAPQTLRCVNTKSPARSVLFRHDRQTDRQTDERHGVYVYVCDRTGTYQSMYLTVFPSFLVFFSYTRTCTSVSLSVPHGCLLCLAAGEHYRSVLKTPKGTDHGNIRNLMTKGWKGVRFPDGLGLALKK